MIEVDATVVSADDLLQRVQALLTSIDPSAVPRLPSVRRPGVGRQASPIEAARHRAQVLHNRFQTITPPEITGVSGLRGEATRYAKRVVRKLTSWYVEPRWAAQIDFDSAAAWAASDLVTALDDSSANLTRVSVAQADAEELIAELERRRVALEEAERERDTSVLKLRHELNELEITIGTVAARLERFRQQMDRSELETPPMPDEYLLPSIDYPCFEHRFRGSSNELAEAQRDYLSAFGAPDQFPRIADIGCGRGEMLELLRAAGFDPIGVDADPAMLELCRAKKLNVIEADALLWLQSLPSAALDGIFCAQVVEHLPVQTLPGFVRASHRVLKPGATLVIETIDPRSAFALGNWFYADMTHVRPIYPPTLAFLAESAGFASVEIWPRSPHPAMSTVDDLPDTVEGSALRALLGAVFGHQDYAVVARK